ncbi:MAG TPA: hypothetical protein VIH56_06725 [Candidatus Acidoferrales bacterium]
MKKEIKEEATKDKGWSKLYIRKSSTHPGHIHVRWFSLAAERIFDKWILSEDLNELLYNETCCWADGYPGDPCGQPCCIRTKRRIKYAQSKSVTVAA